MPGGRVVARGVLGARHRRRQGSSTAERAPALGHEVRGRVPVARTVSPRRSSRTSPSARATRRALTCGPGTGPKRKLRAPRGVAGRHAADGGRGLGGVGREEETRSGASQNALPGREALGVPAGGGERSCPRGPCAAAPARRRVRRAGNRCRRGGLRGRGGRQRLPAKLRRPPSPGRAACRGSGSSSRGSCAWPSAGHRPGGQARPTALHGDGRRVFGRELCAGPRAPRVRVGGERDALRRRPRMRDSSLRYSSNSEVNGLMSTIRGPSGRGGDCGARRVRPAATGLGQAGCRGVTGWAGPRLKAAWGRREAGSLAEYSVAEHGLRKDVRRNLTEYDLLSIVVACLPHPGGRVPMASWRRWRRFCRSRRRGATRCGRWRRSSAVGLAGEFERGDGGHVELGRGCY